VPTGVPAGAALGIMPIHYDSTNNRLYVYNNEWRSVLLAATPTATPVTSLAGTAGQITASAATGDVTLSLPAYPYRPAGTWSTPASLFSGACNPSPFSFGGSVTVTGAPTAFTMQLTTGSGACSALATGFALDFPATWTGATGVICTCSYTSLGTAALPAFSCEASTTQFIFRSGNVALAASSNYFINALCAGYVF